MPTVRRVASRVLVLVPSRRVLLLNMDLPWVGKVWMVPGGGVEPGETLRAAAERELKEETGLAGVEIGPEIWWRDVRIEHGAQRIDQREHYFLVEAREFEPTAQGIGEEEGAWFRGHRWWGVEALERATEMLAPPELPSAVAELIAQGPPRTARKLGFRTHSSPF